MQGTIFIVKSFMYKYNLSFLIQKILQTQNSWFFNVKAMLQGNSLARQTILANVSSLVFDKSTRGKMQTPDANENITETLRRHDGDKSCKFVANKQDRGCFAMCCRFHRIYQRILYSRIRKEKY